MDKVMLGVLVLLQYIEIKSMSIILLSLLKIIIMLGMGGKESKESHQKEITHIRVQVGQVSSVLVRNSIKEEDLRAKVKVLLTKAHPSKK
jgi:hypothetical protein